MVKSIKNLIAAILVSISASIFWTNILPKYDLSSTLKDIIAEKEVTLDKRNQIAKSLIDLQDNYKKRYTEFQRLALVVPEKKSLPELVSTFESISSATGVSLGEVRISGGPSKPEDAINSIGFETDIEAPYDSLFSFLTHLENNIRLIDVISLTITSQKAGSTATQTNPGGAGSLGVQIKARTYYLKPLNEIKMLPSAAPSVDSLK